MKMYKWLCHFIEDYRTPINEALMNCLAVLLLYSVVIHKLTFYTRQTDEGLYTLSLILWFLGSFPIGMGISFYLTKKEKENNGKNNIR